jgi:hypothetical protein
VVFVDWRQWSWGRSRILTWYSQIPPCTRARILCYVKLDDAKKSECADALKKVKKLYKDLDCYGIFKGSLTENENQKERFKIETL